MSPRSGVAALMTLALLGATVAWLGPVASDATQRWNQVRERQHRLQARELALGAAGWTDGSLRTIDGWTVRCMAGRRTVSGPHGMLVMDAAGERWRRAGSPP